MSINRIEKNVIYAYYDNYTAVTGMNQIDRFARYLAEYKS